MEWHDDAVILSVRKHGETAAIASLLTRGHGRHLGLLRGGQSRSRQGMLQPGNRVAAVWRARLADHLGTFTLEPAGDVASNLLDRPLALKALASATALLDAVLAEREPHPELFAATEGLFGALSQAGVFDGQRGGAEGADAPPAWTRAYVGWELALLADLGFGLDLGACAATGSREELIYVSPRSGRAVSAAAGAPYAGKLLALPAFLRPEAPESHPSRDDVAAGLRLTGYFLERHHFASGHRGAPAARARFVDAFAR